MEIKTKHGIDQEISTAIYDEAFGGESAMWMPTHEPDKVGALILYRSVLEKSDLSNILSNVSHEMAHGFQEFLEKQQEKVSEEFLNDQKWFNAFKSRHRQQTNFTDAYKASDIRYRAIPIEQDAWAMQLTSPNELNKIAEQYADSVLTKEGLGTYSDIKNQYVVSKWITRNLKESTTVEDLIREAKKMEYFPDVASRIINLVTGKEMDSILQEVKIAEENKNKADALLGISS